MPCKNGVYGITEEHYADLTHTYPRMDIDKALRKIISYLSSKPHKQPFTSNAKSYVDLWLNEDDNSGKYRKNESYEATYDISEYESSSVCDNFVFDEYT